MKKIKSPSAFILALTMLTSFSACGNSAVDENTSSSVTTEDSGESATTEEAIPVTELATEPTTQEETDPAKEIEKEQYSYYERLSKEWDEYGNCNMLDCKTHTIRGACDNSYIWTYKGMLYRMVDGEEKTTVMSYDMNGNSKVLLESDLPDIYFRSGTFLIYNTWEETVESDVPGEYPYRVTHYDYTIMDPEGNTRSFQSQVKFSDNSGTVAGSGIAACEKAIITTNGDVLIKSSSYNYEESRDQIKISLIKHDSEEVTEIPDPPEEFFLDEYYWFENWSYAGKVYARGLNDKYENFMYCFDCDTLEWSQCAEDLPMVPEDRYQIGRYVYANNDQVFDMENNKFLEEHTPTIESNVGEWYYDIEVIYKTFYTGGKHHFRLENGYWEEVLLSDTYGWGDRYEAFLVKKLGAEDTLPETRYSYATDWYQRYVSIIPVSDTHYVAQDENGIYIRTYEKGQSEEITIISAYN